MTSLKTVFTWRPLQVHHSRHGRGGPEEHVHRDHGLGQRKTEVGPTVGSGQYFYPGTMKTFLKPSCHIPFTHLEKYVFHFWRACHNCYNQSKLFINASQYTSGNKVRMRKLVWLCVSSSFWLHDWISTGANPIKRNFVLKFLN